MYFTLLFFFSFFSIRFFSSSEGCSCTYSFPAKLQIFYPSSFTRYNGRSHSK